jgi:hypothetical protein
MRTTSKRLELNLSKQESQRQGEMAESPRAPSEEQPAESPRTSQEMPDGESSDVGLRVLRPHEGAALLARAQGLSAALMGLTAGQLNRLAEQAAFVELDKDVCVMMQVRAHERASERVFACSCVRVLVSERASELDEA